MVGQLRKNMWVGAVVAAAVWAWVGVGEAGGGSGLCQHGCRCSPVDSRLDNFYRLLPSNLPNGGGNALDAVQRTVGLLLADPSTDWSEIRISRLREHLVDLNVIMMSAEAVEHPVDGGLAITVGGDERTLAALRRVVPDHLRQLEGFHDWKMALEDTGEALSLVVSADDAEEVQLIRGLGFFGLVATGVHRPQSYLGIARGKAP